MKTKILSLCLIYFSFCAVYAQKNSKSEKGKSSASKETKNVLKTKMDTVSYMIAVDIAKNLKANKVEINLEPFTQGFKDKFENKEVFTQDVIDKYLIEYQKELQEKQKKQMELEAQVNKAKGKEFLETNKKNFEDIIETPSGLQYRVISPGEGPHPGPNSKVTVHYEGRLLDGSIFDSSYKRGEPATFNLNQVIEGWREGLQLMSRGSIFELFIPSHLGYGDRALPTIPAGSTLIFKVELLNFE